MKLTGSPQATMTPKVELGNWRTKHLGLLRGFSDTAEIELNAILSHTLEKPVAWLLAHPETPLTNEQATLLNITVKRLCAGEPLAYITGERAFYGMDFHVNPGVLIPRPETELLIDHAIAWLNNHPARNSAADIGTGSGVIAVTLASRFPSLEIIASDISSEALGVARENAARHNVSHQITFIQADVLQHNERKFDLILANLPYIPTKTLDESSALRYEPRLALDGGSDGLRLITILIQQLQGLLLPGGCAILEIQYNQGSTVGEIARQHLPGSSVEIYADLASLPRIAKIQL